jgi:hypothetical protein
MLFLTNPHSDNFGMASEWSRTPHADREGPCWRLFFVPRQVTVLYKPRFHVLVYLEPFRERNVLDCNRMTPPESGERTIP